MLTAPVFSELDFARSFDRLYPALLSTARRLACCGTTDAEDLVCAARLVALRRLHCYDAATGSEGLSRWLYTILGHVCQSHRRRQRQTPNIALECLSDTLYAAPAPAPDPDLTHALHALSAPARALLEGLAAGYTQSEIAQAYGIHRNTVGARLKEARQILQAHGVGQ